MPTKIVLRIGSLRLTGELFDTAAGRAMAASLPIECRWSRWGEEYYGDTRPSFGAYPGESTDLMEIGDLAYHAESGWFCLFFGPTPASRGTEPRAAVPVQKVGRVAGDWSALKALGDSIKALVSAAD
jgi:hypothetical protein